jgi:hypothetical protein
MRVRFGLLIITTVYLGLSAISCQCGTTVEVGLTVEPSTEEVKPGAQFQVVIQVTPRKQGISAVEINLSFEPRAIQVVEVRSGTLLGQRPLPGISDIDNQSGTLSYSLARIGETATPTPANPFAEITFQVLDSAQTGDYQLSITSIGLANESFEAITNIQSQEATIKIE